MSEDISELLATHRWAYYIPETAFVPGRGFRVSIIVEGHDGHWPTGDLNFKAPNHVEPWFWGMEYRDAEHEAATQNAARGLSEQDVFDIYMSTVAPPDMRRGRKRKGK
jgi:hypothetical protein